MPFKSAKQRRYLYAAHPTIAKRWAKKYGTRIKKGTHAQRQVERQRA